MTKGEMNEGAREKKILVINFLFTKSTIYTEQSNLCHDFFDICIRKILIE